ncbi:MAG: NnrS family protein [gamma proteobacterium symbiont of Taylorina sp.]|nr:NnrS family protein [gamma proteobacterium symbiont of Taylorina sp.]
MFIQIDEQQKKSFALFNLGFRPFFLVSAYSAIILMAIWGLLYTNSIELNNYYGVIDWHSHEMLFGYSIAVVAGFLLTAVKNWTNVDTISKTPLAILAGVWLLARILPFTPAPGMLIALVDISFFFLLMLAVAHPIIKVKQWNNLIIIAILGSFLLADILVQGQHLGFISTGVIQGNSLAIYSVLLIIQVLTGRVMPHFTRIVVPGTEVVERPALEKTLLVGLVLLAIADVLALNNLLISFLAGILLVAHIMRVFPWFSKPVLDTPILWVLYAGYLWLLIGFIMKVFVGFGWVTNNLAIHAWTVGTIGITTYGMMSRVALGHTGREMVPPRFAVAGFYLLFMAAFIRVILPLISMSHYILWIELSILFWILAFTLFAIAYTPVLTQPRVDGRSG